MRKFIIFWSLPGGESDTRVCNWYLVPGMQLVPSTTGTKYQNPTLREYFALFSSSIFHLSHSSSSPLNLFIIINIIAMIFNEWIKERESLNKGMSDTWYLVPLANGTWYHWPLARLYNSIITLVLNRVLNQTLPWNLLSSKTRVTRMDVVPLVPHIHGTKYQISTLREFSCLLFLNYFSHSLSLLLLLLHHWI